MSRRWQSWSKDDRRRFVNRETLSRWHRYARLQFEGLENRVAPATYTWNNPAGGDWDTIDNWTANGSTATVLPGLADDVVIPILNAGASITHTQDQADSVNSLSSQAPLSISAGSITLATTSSIAGNLTISGTGGAVVNGNLTATTVSLTGGFLAGNGDVVAAVSNIGGTVYPGGNGTIGSLAITGTFSQAQAAHSPSISTGAPRGNTTN